jgi:NAD(P)-dependent dehydrogenase (short-subunit alcohol dehydrogenase family)
LNATAEKANAWFITISALDGSFGFKGGPIVDPTQGALAGLAKTASIEWPRVRCLALDIDPAWQDFPAIARTLADEISIAHDHRETEIGLSPQRRVTLRLSSVSVPEKDKIELNAGDVVVITGGARGVTSEAAKALAARTECTLVLMGRSPHPQPEPAWLKSLDDEGQIKKAILTHQFSGLSPSPKDIEKQYRYWSVNRQIQNTLDALKRLGASAYYYPVDVNDASAILDAVSRIGRELGPIKAFIHGAGVLEDRLIVDKQLDQFNKVYNTKVNGLLNFLDVLSDEALTYLVLFSSVSARIGNQGQVDYAMANEVLNKIACQQSHLRPQCKVLAINWGPWDGGMVTPALKRNFLKNNVALIPPDEGASALLAEMANHSSQDVEVVIGGLLNRPSSKKLPAQPANQACPTPADLFLTCKRVVDVAHHPVLQSHLLDGRPVVPLALIAEWLAHSALHANPGLTLHGMDNLRLFNGITLDSQKRIIQMLAGKASRKGQTFEVDVEIRDDACDGACRVHCRAKAILTDRLPAAPPFEENGHFKTNGHPPSINDFYGRVLFHGRDLHGIREIIRISEDGISARLTSAPAPIKWMKEPLRTRWIADPLILDCAFQMAIIWCHEQLGQVSLPSFAATYRQYCDRFPREGIVAVLEVRTSNERKLIGDFTFLDKSKQVIAHLKGYEAIMAPGLFKAFKAA